MRRLPIAARKLRGQQAITIWHHVLRTRCEPAVGCERAGTAAAVDSAEAPLLGAAAAAESGAARGSGTALLGLAARGALLRVAEFAFSRTSSKEESTLLWRRKACTTAAGDACCLHLSMRTHVHRYTDQQQSDALNMRHANAQDGSTLLGERLTDFVPGLETGSRDAVREDPACLAHCHGLRACGRSGQVRA